MTRSLPLGDRIIVLCGKERELKIEGRYFSKNSFNARLGQVATEKAVAHDIFQFIDFQSMTLTYHETVRRLAAFSSRLQPDKLGELYILLTLDFSSWNQNFRLETMENIMILLDQLYGFQHTFTYSQRFPLESLIVVNDAYNPPKQILGTFWNHSLIWIRVMVGGDAPKTVDIFTFWKNFFHEFIKPLCNN